MGAYIIHMSSPQPVSDSTPDMHAALLAALKVVGSQEKLAAICGCTAPNVWQLIRRGSALPGRFVLKVEAATGISRIALRPDLYPADQFSQGDA